MAATINFPSADAAAVAASPPRRLSAGVSKQPPAASKPDPAAVAVVIVAGSGCVQDSKRLPLSALEEPPPSPRRRRLLDDIFLPAIAASVSMVLAVVWNTYLRADTEIRLATRDPADKLLRPPLVDSDATNPQVGQLVGAGSSSAPESTVSLLLSLAIVVSLGILGGRLSERARQAPMLGMLLFGVLARNLMPSIVLPLPHSWTAQFWTIALSAVVSRAGLSLQLDSIKANFIPVLLLGSVPVLLEASFLAPLVGMVFKLPLAWCFALAFGVASISPGVVVPLVLNLLEVPAWKGSRLPPLLLASTGLDVLIATTGFGVSVAAIFGHKHESESGLHSSFIFRGFEEIGGGVCTGVLWGSLAYLLMRAKVAENFSTWIVFALSTAGMMYGKTHGFPGAASSSVIISWAFVGNLWDEASIEMANKRLKLVWRFAEPFLFPLIGASVSLMEIPPSIILLAILCVALSIMVRMLIALTTSWVVGLTPDEGIFTCGLLAGKASVQAALSTVTMEAVHHHGLQGTPDDGRSRIVFACMVAAIMLGAPFAASWVSVFGARGPGSSQVGGSTAQSVQSLSVEHPAKPVNRPRRRSSAVPATFIVGVPGGDAATKAV